MAFLHGNFDAWTGFARGQVWGQEGEEWAFGYPEESWDLLKEFYPLSAIEPLYRLPCPNEPQGYYTGTPFGVTDILPVESDVETMEKYKVLAFLGWNTAEPSQIDKLVKFIENGGTLLLGWPHLYTCVRRSDAFGNNPEILDNKYINALVGLEIQEFIKTEFENKTVTAGRVLLKGAVAVIQNADGIPIVVENKLGDGKVLFINIRAYPAEDSVKGLYTRLLNQLGHYMVELERERGWLSCSNEIGFTVYDHNVPGKLRTIYFINVDWWNDECIPSEAYLFWGDRDIKMDVTRGNINILTLSEKWAIWITDDETDVIDIQESENEVSIKLQGMGSTNVIIFSRESDNKKYELMLKCTEGNADVEPLKTCEYGWRVEVQLNGPLTMEISILQ
jgi:hypothetical protein